MFLQSLTTDERFASARHIAKLRAACRHARQLLMTALKPAHQLITPPQVQDLRVFCSQASAAPEAWLGVLLLRYGGHPPWMSSYRPAGCYFYTGPQLRRVLELVQLPGACAGGNPTSSCILVRLRGRAAASLQRCPTLLPWCAHCAALLPHRPPAHCSTAWKGGAQAFLAWGRPRPGSGQRSAFAGCALAARAGRLLRPGPAAARLAVDSFTCLASGAEQARHCM